MRPPPLPAGPGVLKVLCWNVAGLRALLAKDAGALSAVVQREQPDVLCLQETKLQEEHVKVVEAASQLLAPAGPMAAAVWNCSSEKKGYAGTAVFCRQPPLSVARGIGAPQHDGEGRVVTVELADVYVVNAYVPNSGDGLKRLDYRTKEWDQAFSAYVRGLEAKKPVIIAGDMNCCPEVRE